jgi:hypothetical protein
LNAAARQPLCVRVEALYAAAQADAPGAKPLVRADEFASLNTATASSAVRLGVSEVTDDTRGGPRNLRLRAENSGATSTGAWARDAVLSRSLPQPRGTGAFACWSGRRFRPLLNVQLGCRANSWRAPDHYDTLDFTAALCGAAALERDTRAWTVVGPTGHRLACLIRTNLDMAHIRAGQTLPQRGAAGGGVT